MRKKWIAAALLSVVLAGCGEAQVSGTPMPLTEAGMEKLNWAAGQVDSHGFAREVQQFRDDLDSAAQLAVEFYSGMFEAAGYSFEATLVEAGQGMSGSEEERRAFANASHWGLSGLYPIAKILAAFESKGVDLADHLHPEAAGAVRALAEMR